MMPLFRLFTRFGNPNEIENRPASSSSHHHHASRNHGNRVAAPIAMPSQEKSYRPIGLPVVDSYEPYQYETFDYGDLEDLYDNQPRESESASLGLTTTPAATTTTTAARQFQKDATFERFRKPSLTAGLGDHGMHAVDSFSEQDSIWPLVLVVSVVTIAVIVAGFIIFLAVQKYRKTGYPQRCLCRFVIQCFEVFKNKTKSACTCRKKESEYVKLGHLYQRKGGNYIVMLGSPQVSLDADELSLSSEDECYNRLRDRTVSLSNLAINDTIESDDFNNSAPPLDFSTPKRDSILGRMTEVLSEPD